MFLFLSELYIEKNDKGEKKNVAVREKRNHSDVPTKKVVLKKRKNEDENSKKHLEKTKRTRMNTLWSPSRKNRFGRPRKGTVGLHSRIGKGVRKDRVKGSGSGRGREIISSKERMGQYSRVNQGSSQWKGKRKPTTSGDTEPVLEDGASSPDSVEDLLGDSEEDVVNNVETDKQQQDLPPKKKVLLSPLSSREKWRLLRKTTTRKSVRTKT